MSAVTPELPSARRDEQSISAPVIADGTDPSPCPNPACRAPGWPLVGKPLNWPWAEHCWNCKQGLRSEGG
jgi:hypothetical protein